MTKQRDDRVYLRHILEGTERIERYLKGVDQSGFREDTLRQDGVIRQLEVIGEAVKQLSEDLRASYEDVPWKDIAGMRDKLIHHYFGVDLDAVWEAATKDIPRLQQQVESILSSH